MLRNAKRIIFGIIANVFCWTVWSLSVTEQFLVIEPVYSGLGVQVSRSDYKLNWYTDEMIQILRAQILEEPQVILEGHSFLQLARDGLLFDETSKTFPFSYICSPQHLLCALSRQDVPSARLKLDNALIKGICHQFPDTQVPLIICAFITSNFFEELVFVSQLLEKGYAIELHCIYAQRPKQAELFVAPFTNAVGDSLLGWFEGNAVSAISCLGSRLFGTKSGNAQGHSFFEGSDLLGLQLTQLLEWFNVAYSGRLSLVIYPSAEIYREVFKLPFAPRPHICMGLDLDYGLPLHQASANNNAKIRLELHSLESIEFYQTALLALDVGSLLLAVYTTHSFRLREMHVECCLRNAEALASKQVAILFDLARVQAQGREYGWSSDLARRGDELLYIIKNSEGLKHWGQCTDLRNFFISCL